ncbi:MAG: DUF1015 domain-containing protein [Oscillospiraceae bacterium]|nr:DUF1015 domain-containing protein [Oscillospiraceae bacterium]
MKNCFVPFAPADILIPRVSSPEKFAVVACDQYTSEPDYWNRVEEYVGCAKSSLHLVFPEIYLEHGSQNPQARIRGIHQAAQEYLTNGVFEEYKGSYICTERALKNGKIRRGLIGAADLEAYDYRNGSNAMIRATEGTVLERIPPRVEIRRDAALELPHVMLLIDDERQTVIEQLDLSKCEKIYDFELMENGGHLTGYLLTDTQKNFVDGALGSLAEKTPLLFAVGDGNHSLAAAKHCYEEQKERGGDANLSRYALCEIVNLHDDSLEFEPIHRILTGVKPERVKAALHNFYNLTDIPEPDDHLIHYISQNEEKTLYLRKPKTSQPVGTIQDFIEHCLQNDDIRQREHCKVDYIHGEDVLRELANEPDAVGFLTQGIHKSQLFGTVIKDGALVRKTFSMGQANDKRFYFEARKIKR